MIGLLFQLGDRVLLSLEVAFELCDVLTRDFDQGSDTASQEHSQGTWSSVACAGNVKRKNPTLHPHAGKMARRHRLGEEDSMRVLMRRSVSSSFLVGSPITHHVSGCGNRLLH